VPPLALKGKSEPVVAHRLPLGGRRSGVRARLDTPMVGARPSSTGCATRSARPCATGRASSSRSSARGHRQVASAARVPRLARRRPDPAGRCVPYGEGSRTGPSSRSRSSCRAGAFDGAGDEAIAALLRDEDLATSREEIAYAFRKLLRAVARERRVSRLRRHPLGRGDVPRPRRARRRPVAGRPILLLCSRDRSSSTAARLGGGKVNATTVLLEPLRRRRPTR
jgi:hypothetical protein